MVDCLHTRHLTVFYIAKIRIISVTSKYFYGNLMIRYVKQLSGLHEILPAAADAMAAEPGGMTSVLYGKPDISTIVEGTVAGCEGFGGFEVADIQRVCFVLVAQTGL